MPNPFFYHVVSDVVTKLLASMKRNKNIGPFFRSFLRVRYTHKVGAEGETAVAMTITESFFLVAPETTEVTAIE